MLCMETRYEVTVEQIGFKFLKNTRDDSFIFSVYLVYILCIFGAYSVYFHHTRTGVITSTRQIQRMHIRMK